jgi:predicted aspartyl protease
MGEVTVATLNNAPIVTLLANGRAVTLLLDTGAARTILTPAAVQRIGAQTPHVEFPRQIAGIGSAFAAREVELQSWMSSSVEIPWRRVLIAPITVLSVAIGPLDELLGADVLTQFEVDLDLPHRRMALYKKSSYPPNWTERYAAISVDRSGGRHLFFPVQLEGRKITAFIDTDAQVSSGVYVAYGEVDPLTVRDIVYT